MVARTRESSPSRATRAQGRRPSVGPLALPSSGHCVLFFYCRPQPESQQEVLEKSPIPLSPTYIHTWDVNHVIEPNGTFKNKKSSTKKTKILNIS